MELKKLFLKGENLFAMGLLLLLAAYVVLLMVGDVDRMQMATTNYDYYLLGVSVLLYFVWANIFSSNVFNHIEPKFLEKFPRMINTLYTGPLYWMIIGYFFTPKILKDAQKLKEEQDLTV